MRNTFALAAALTMSASVAFAVPTRCPTAADQSAFDVGALKSELSVLATACSEDAGYNAFVEKYRSTLLSQDHVVNAWFSRTYGKAAQSRYDTYITLLANGQSDESIKEGSDYCPRLKPLFTEVMALPNGTVMPQYAAGKNLFPADVQACESLNATRAAATTSRGRSTTTATKKRR